MRFVTAFLLFTSSAMAAEDSTLRVAVVDGEGYELPTARVELISATVTSDSEVQETAESGQVAFRVPSAGIYTLRVSLEGFVPVQIPWFSIGTGRTDLHWRVTLNGAPLDFASVGLHLDLPTRIGVKTLAESELLDLRESVLRLQLGRYEQLPPQAGEEKGDSHCVVFDAPLRERGTDPPLGFLERLSGLASLHPGSWCRSHRGRVYSVGPVVATTDKQALAWSASWATYRRGWATCLVRLAKEDRRWQPEPNCVEGAIVD